MQRLNSTAASPAAPEQIVIFRAPNLLLIRAGRALRIASRPAQHQAGGITMRLSARVASTSILAAFVAANCLTPTIARGQQPGQQPQQPAANAAAGAAAGGKVTYDKSLAPDGKPWTADSVIKYLRDNLPNLEFTVVNRLELSHADLKSLLTRDDHPSPNAGPQPAGADRGHSPAKKVDRKEAAKLRRQREAVKREQRRNASDSAKPAAKQPAKPPEMEKKLVYSETPLRTALLDQVSQQFNVEPDRVILDFCGSRKRAYALPAKKHFEGRPEDHFNDEQAQNVYWILAAEIIDFRGNEAAAKAYEKGFNENVSLHCYRWYSVVFTGGSVQQLSMLLRFGEFAIPVNGAWQNWKIDPYPGYPVAAP